MGGSAAGRKRNPGQRAAPARRQASPVYKARGAPLGCRSLPLSAPRRLPPLLFLPIGVRFLCSGQRGGRGSWRPTTWTPRRRRAGTAAEEGTTTAPRPPARPRRRRSTCGGAGRPRPPPTATATAPRPSASARRPRTRGRSSAASTAPPAPTATATATRRPLPPRPPPPPPPRRRPPCRRRPPAPSRRSDGAHPSLWTPEPRTAARQQEEEGREQRGKNVASLCYVTQERALICSSLHLDAIGENSHFLF
ncbi:hypothetical protein PVAP13_7NG158800 [Panicum virgatum]|uniref:Uncharacterized protein n=1 Tax=Panicum virgatum TaxID=38727 RepID=A0A8T0PYL6_PANVG|nr:hypothetical protein PVAP13_7NG158800 [Panicum virgatum]